MNSTTKAWIAAGFGILFSIALIAWQVKAGRGVVSLSPEDMALIVADQQPQARARMATDEKARKDFAQNIREILAVAEEARLKGLAYRPDLKRQLDLARTVVIAQSYFKSEGAAPGVTSTRSTKNRVRRNNSISSSPMPRRRIRKWPINKFLTNS